MPTETPARSISARVASMAGLVSDHLPGFHRRSESNMGFSIQSVFGCCIQASMITVAPPACYDTFCHWPPGEVFGTAAISSVHRGTFTMALGGLTRVRYCVAVS